MLRTLTKNTERTIQRIQARTWGRARQVALSGGGLAAFTYAGFMYSRMVGFIVLGVALLLADYAMDKD